jgi:hypothetical protein
MRAAQKVRLYSASKDSAYRMLLESCIQVWAIFIVSGQKPKMFPSLDMPLSSGGTEEGKKQQWYLYLMVSIPL